MQNPSIQTALFSIVSQSTSQNGWARCGGHGGLGGVLFIYEGTSYAQKPILGEHFNNVAGIVRSCIDTRALPSGSYFIINSRAGPNPPAQPKHIACRRARTAAPPGGLPSGCLTLTQEHLQAVIVRAHAVYRKILRISNTHAH